MIYKKIDWDEIRKLFPATETYTYLNAAGGSPLSVNAAAEGKSFYDEMLAHGDLYWEKWLDRTDRTRLKVANFINADPEEIAFTVNTSHGMNIIAEMLRGKGGVVTMEDEFPTSTFPWMHRDYPVHFVRPVEGAYTMENIGSSLRGDPKILVSSYVQYRTGFRQDLVELGALCEEQGLIYVVNATQGIGAMPIDVRKAKIDFLVFTGVKWPMAGYGIGVLYINKKWFDILDIPFAGWQSVVEPESMDNRKMDLKKDASQVEVGCPHFPNIFALGASLDLLDSIGSENIRNRIFELNRYLVERLAELKMGIVTPLEEKHRSGITVIRVPHADEVAEKLFSRNIVVTSRGEGIRISLHVYNNEGDIDTLVTELKDII